MRPRDFFFFFFKSIWDLSKPYPMVCYALACDTQADLYIKCKTFLLANRDKYACYHLANEQSGGQRTWKVNSSQPIIISFRGNNSYSLHADAAKMPTAIIFPFLKTRVPTQDLPCCLSPPISLHFGVKRKAPDFYPVFINSEYLSIAPYRHGSSEIREKKKMHLPRCVATKKSVTIK